ncbi:baseplate assembly protein, partial [Klebsiella pneumoniae]|nr:baseplate assembly protein [Klebsiella pneumoniae]
RDVRLSAIYAALHVQGVQRVELMQPLADMVIDKTQASYCIDFKAEIGGSDE